MHSQKTFFLPNEIFDHNQKLANRRDFFQAEKHKNVTIFPGLNHGNPVRTETQVPVFEYNLLHTGNS